AAGATGSAAGATDTWRTLAIAIVGPGGVPLGAPAASGERAEEMAGALLGAIGGFGVADDATLSGACGLAGTGGDTGWNEAGSGLRVLLVEALRIGWLKSRLVSALRLRAGLPPNTTPTRCRLPRLTEVTTLKPDMRMYPVLMPSVPG